MYPAMSSKDRCFGRSSSKSIADTWPFWPKKFLLVGSMRLTLTSRAAFGNENPRSMIPFTTLNIVVTPQTPRARTVIASAQKPFSRRRTRSPTRRSWTNVSATIGVAPHDHTSAVDRSFREVQRAGRAAAGAVDGPHHARSTPSYFVIYNTPPNRRTGHAGRPSTCAGDRRTDGVSECGGGDPRSEAGTSRGQRLCSRQPSRCPPAARTGLRRSGRGALGLQLRRLERSRPADRSGEQGRRVFLSR